MKFSFRRSLSLGVVIAVTAAALVGCATDGGSSAESSSSTDGTLTIATLSPPVTFAAKDAQWANQSPYVQAVYDTLLRTTPDGTVEPWLATEWSYDDSNTQLTLELRTDVTFTDGTAFTADAAAQNLLRFRDGASPQKSYLADLADAQAVDDSTLLLTLAEPNPSLLSFLSQNPGLMASPKSFDSPTEKTNPVGSGPYVLDTKATVVGSTYVFTRNEDYFAPDQQHYAKVVMNVFATPTAIVNAIQGGQVNGAPVTDNGSLEQVEAAGFTAHGQQLNFFGLMLFDRDGRAEEPLGDVRVRQAINHAFDKEALLDALARGYGTVTAQIFSPESDGYVEELDSAYPYDPEKAKDLLADAGYAPGSITLTQPQASGTAPAAYALVKQYLNAVDINVNFVPQAPTSFLTDALAAKFPSMLFSLKAAPTTWETVNLDIAEAAAWNPFRYTDPKVEALIQTIQTGTESESSVAAKALNEYVVDQAWFAPWYRPQQSYASDPTTSVEVQAGNAYPYLWNFVPKG